MNMNSSNKLLFSFMLLILSFSVFSEKREKDLLSLINLEIKSIEKVKKKGEQLDYRLFELYSEKTKIMRRTEHELALKDQAAGKKVNKTEYYKQSQLVFNHAYKFGQAFFKAYPKSRYLSNVYYGLASNQIEVQNTIEKDQKEIIEWLTMALKKANNPEKKYLSQVKLAEVYYTVKNYELAIKNFEPVIKNKNDRWYTKNIYNLSWCYFQTKEYDKAVAFALTAYKYSKIKKYENVSEQSMDALDYFFVFSKRPDEAIAFHIKNNTDPVSRMEHFVKLLNLSQKFISSDVALQTEKPARAFCLKMKDYSCLFHMSAFKLDVYKEGKNYDQHLVTVRNIHKEVTALKNSKIAYDENTLNQIINNIGETASTFQQLAYKSHYAFKNNAEDTYKTIIEYYQTLKFLNPTFHHEYAFLQAELSYKEKKYNEAGKFYYESLTKVDKKTTPPEFAEKLFKSMIALANDASFGDKVFFEKVHVSYIDYYQTDDRVIPIYQALFKFYQSEKQYPKSEELLVSYSTKIPKEIQTHKEMMKVVLNNYITTKDSTKLNDWITQLKKGFLKFEKPFIEQNVAILAQLLFEKAQQKEAQKDYAAAIKEYQAIVDNKDYATEIKADSLYNIAINYIRLRDADKSISHLKESLRLKTKKDLLKKVSDLQVIAREYVTLQSLNSSSMVYKFLFKNFCQELASPDATFLTYTQIEIAQNRTQIFNNPEEFKKCVFKNDSIKLARSIYIDWLWENKKFMELADLHKRPDYALHFDEIFHEFYSIIWRFEENSKDPEYILAKEQLEKFYNATKSKLNEESHAKYAALEAWKSEGQELQNFEKHFVKLGEVSGDIATLQPKLETELNKLMELKDTKLANIEKIKDPNLYQAELYGLTMRFQVAKHWIGLWKCKSKNPDEPNQWLEVQKQVTQGLNDQMISFKDAISKVISNGALPLMSLQKVRGDADFEQYFYQAPIDRPHFIRTRGLASNQASGEGK